LTAADGSASNRTDRSTDHGARYAAVDRGLLRILSAYAL
jgi:hypothetical protein